MFDAGEISTESALALRDLQGLFPSRIACDDEGGLEMTRESQAVGISLWLVAHGARPLGRREP